MKFFFEKNFWWRWAFWVGIVVVLGVMIRTVFGGVPGMCQSFASTQQTNHIGADELSATLQSPLFPKFSYSPLRKQMAPMSFVFIGSKEQLRAAFQKAKWLSSDSWNVRTTSRLALAALRDLPYPAAPVTPSCFGGSIQVMSFQKPTARNSARERHHIRVWETHLKAEGKEVWVGTASFDSDSYLLLAHLIAPDIDTERDFIVAELRAAGARHRETIVFVPPHHGSNQGGDAYETDGKIAIIDL